MLEHDVVKRYSLKIDRRPVTKTADDVWMTHAIQRHSFILKILNQGTFELRVLIALQKNIERFDYNLTKALVGGAAIARHKSRHNCRVQDILQCRNDRRPCIVRVLARSRLLWRRFAF